MRYEISGGFTFYGYIPNGSNEQHLGIVLGVKEPLLRYCYCTSKKKYKYITHDETDIVRISASVMKKYFRSPQETFIFLSQHHIIEMLIINFKSRLSDNEYEARDKIDDDIYIAILNKIRNSDNLSDRFKRDFFSFIE